MLGGHVLLVLLLSISRPSDSRKGRARTEPRTVLVLLNLEPRVEELPVEQTREPPPTASVSRIRSDRPRQKPVEAPSDDGDETSDSTAISAPEGSDGNRKIDWQLEMDITVKAMEPKLLKEFQRQCAEAERTRAPLPFGCQRRYDDKPWRPSGNLAKDMRDPNRPRSSVPDPLPDAFPKPPRLEGLKDEE